MKNAIASPLIVVAALIVSGCSQRGHKSEDVQVSERTRQESAKFLELASEHHASVDWLESLPDRGIGGRVFTIDLTTALVRTNAQPVAMEAFLEDVTEKDGEFTGHFSFFSAVTNGSGGNPDILNSNLRLVLHCSKQQTAVLLKSKPTVGGIALFAVVARSEEHTSELQSQ